MTSESPRAREEGRRGPWVAVVVFVAIGAAGIALVLRAPHDRFLPHEETAPSMGSAELPVSAAPLGPRCERLGPGVRHRIGVGGALPASTASAPGPSDDEPEERDEPFAAEVGRAVALSDAFAVGVRTDGPAGADAGIVKVPIDGSAVVEHRLGRSRGDMPPPVVVADGGESARGWLAGTLEPDAADFALRVTSSVRAGATDERGLDLKQARDESTAFDLASGPSVAIAVWDDVTKDETLARVVYAVLSADGSKLIKKSRAVSSHDVDADTPRIVARPGGFWLAYIGRKRRDLPVDSDDPALERTKDEERYSAERIDPSFIDVLVLDEHGELSGAARTITPPTGHALGFDLALRADGAARIVWRDDDTPSGAGGGRVEILTVLPSGVTETQVVAADDLVAGLPTLLPGWLALSDTRGRTRLAPLAEDGALAAELRHEPAVGTGQPIAAHAITAGQTLLLVATPAGTAVELSTLRCTR
ncbi:MAG: hypothetical protein EXR75_10145 [Myxococcales bacterium]|nr:hypothetical protein [Myxococcales bacterium]